MQVRSPRFSRPHARCFGFLLLALWQLVYLAESNAASVPEWYRKQAKDQPAFPELLANPLAYDGRVVILGGRVVRAKTTEGVFRLQLVEQPLSKGWGSSYRPKKGETSAGCFYAIIPGFVDRSDLVPGAEMTIAGTVKGAQPGQLGDDNRLVPVVRASWMRVWNARQRRPEGGSGGNGGPSAMGMYGPGGMYGPMGMGMFGPMGMYGPMGMGPWY